MRYSKSFEVHYYEVDKNQRATPTSILNYLEESAISHSEAVGYGIARLKAMGAAWVLNRWFLEMESYPAWSEKVIIETWPSSFERFYATRQFYIKNAKGQILGRAASLWIFINFLKKRPIRIPLELGEAYGIDTNKAVEYAFNELDNLNNADYDGIFSVRKSDIDTNNHVNNTKYVEWMLEAIPQSVHENLSLALLEVIYQKEIGYGTTIISQCEHSIDNETYGEFCHAILDGNNGVKATAGRTVWKKMK